MKEAEERLIAFEKQQAEAKEAVLKEKGDTKALLEIRDQELAKERKERAEMERTLSEGTKLDSFLTSIKATHGDVPKQYWPLINTAKIIIDPNTGIPDQGSVNDVINNFVTQYSAVIQGGVQGNDPGFAPGKTQTGLSRTEWLKLSAADMKKRYAEVVENESKNNN